MGRPRPGRLRGLAGDLGYQHADILTYVAAGAQIGAGVLLVLGSVHPAGGRSRTGLPDQRAAGEVAAAHDEARLRVFLPDGHEFEIILIVVAAAIILIGPGRYGFDAGRGWARRPFIGSFAALMLGIGGGIAVWVLLNGANPFA